MKHFPLLTFSVLPIGVLLISAWQKPKNNYADKGVIQINQTDTTPKNNYKEGDLDMQDFDKAMKELNNNMATLSEQMKNLNVNIDKQIQESLSKINFEEIEKQTEASLKQIDWTKMQQQINNSVQEAQKQIAQIDFTKMQNQMKDLQEKFNSEEFKSQFDSEKLHKQIDDAMSKAKEGMEKAKEELQRMKDFTNELAADGLIDKKKGYTIQWKNGSLYINGDEQPKNISDKYRKYEDKNGGEIKMQPDGAEEF